MVDSVSATIYIFVFQVNFVENQWKSLSKLLSFSVVIPIYLFIFLFFLLYRSSLRTLCCERFDGVFIANEGHTTKTKTIEKIFTSVRLLRNFSRAILRIPWFSRKVREFRDFSLAHTFATNIEIYRATLGNLSRMFFSIFFITNMRNWGEFKMTLLGPRADRWCSFEAYIKQRKFVRIKKKQQCRARLQRFCSNARWSTCLHSTTWNSNPSTM